MDGNYGHSADMEVGRVIKEDGAGVTISSQSGHRMPALSPEADEQLAVTPAVDEFNGPRADFLIDGGATASYFYGPLKPEA